MSQQHCSHCGVVGKDQRLRQCVSCKMDAYCSKTCQAEHWPKHKKLCNQHSHSQVRQHSHSTSKPNRSKKEDSLVALVGKRCMVECYIQGFRTLALWDTGSQVCIVDEKWKKRHLPHEKLRDISELLDAPDDLKITAANGQNMPYKGFIEVTFGLAAEGADPKELVVPMLVMKGKSLSQPILGFNVIEQIVKTHTKEQLDAARKEQWHRALRTAFPSLEKENVTAFIDLVATEQTCDYVVKTTREKVNIPKHTSVQIDCKVTHSHTVTKERHHASV